MKCTAWCRRMTVGLFVLSLAAWPAGCGAKGPDYDLVIMSPHDEKITEEFEHGFAKMFMKTHGRPPKVSWRDVGAGTEAQMRFILDQFAQRPEGIGVDLFFGGGIDPYRTLKAKGLLVSHRIANLSEVPKELLGVPVYDKDCEWYGSVLSSFGILYNKALLKRLGVGEPTTWEDMTDPKLTGFVGLADPSRSGSARAIYEVILQAYGWDKGMRILTLMAANARGFYSGSGDLVKDVAMGQVAEGPAIDFYGWTQIAETGEDALGLVLPERLTVVTPDTIAILKGAPNLANARMFVDFVMSEDGQRLWMLKAGSPGGPVKYGLMRMPVLPRLYDEYPASEKTVKLNPFTFTSSFRHDAEKGSARREIVADLMKSLLMQPQEQLRACWKAVQASGREQELIPKMTRMPVTEEEALEMARKWSDQVFRSRKMTEWVQFALKKYREVSDEAQAAGK